MTNAISSLLVNIHINKWWQLFDKMFPMHFMPLDFLLFNIKNQYKRIYGVCVILMIFFKLLITFTARIQYKIKSDIVHTCIYDIHVLHSLKYIRSIIPIIVGISILIECNMNCIDNAVHFNVCYFIIPITTATKRTWKIKT